MLLKNIYLTEVIFPIHVTFNKYLSSLLLAVGIYKYIQS